MFAFERTRDGVRGSGLSDLNSTGQKLYSPKLTQKHTCFLPRPPHRQTMSAPENMSSYTPVEVSTPTKPNYNTPISTPSRVALLKPNFLMSDSPIKFSLTPDKVKLKDVELDDWETEEPESRASRIGKLVLRILIFLSWLVLLAAAIYL